MVSTKALGMTVLLLPTLCLGACGGEETAGSDDIASKNGMGAFGGLGARPELSAQGASRTLPTVVQLSWDAFPSDPGPDYQVKGRVWAVSTKGADNAAGTEAAPLRTISAALASAQTGDLVRVHAGQYAETSDAVEALVMDKPGVVLTAAAGETVTVVPSSSTQRFGLVLEASDLLVNGINLEGFHPAIQLGSEVATQRRVVISNLELKGPAAGGDGIVAYADGAARGIPVIDGLLIRNVRVAGFSLSVSCNVGPCNSVRLENVTVAGAQGSGSGADAVAFESGDNLLFDRVDVSGSTADGIDTKATRVVVWDSYVHQVGRNGVKLWYGGDIVNTCIRDTGADGAVVVKSGDQLRLLHTTIANAGRGAEAYSMTVRYDDNGPIRVDIINSVISGAGGGMYLSERSTVSIRNSLFHGSANGLVLSRGPLNVAEASGPNGITAAGLGQGNFIGDPGLDGNLRPVAGSALANHGVRLGSEYPSTDLDGHPRVKGSAPDIGAFETF